MSSPNATDMLGRGMEFLAGKLGASVSRRATCTRGAYSVTLPVTVGNTLLSLTDDLGNVRVERTDRDFCFAASDFVLNGSQATPETGDVWTEAADGVTYTFEVLPYEGEPCWRWADPHRVMIRVHTKLTQEA